MLNDMGTDEEAVSQPTIFTSLKRHKGNATKTDTTATMHRSAVLLPESQAPSRIDGRVTNRGASQRQRYTARFKMNFIEEVEELMQSNGLSNPIEVFRDIKKDNIRTATMLAQQYHKWTKNEVYKKTIDACWNNTDSAAGHRKRLNTSKHESPFLDVEALLYRLILDRRKNANKVSTSFIRITALSLFAKCKEEKPDKWKGISFKASRGWMCRFLKRRKLKFRKRKSGKEHTVEELLPAYKKFLTFLRFRAIVPSETDSERHELWGRFPPDRRYNFDQVPLPFIVDQDHTYTTEDDEHPQIKAQSEALRKRQFTMHVVTNAGTGERAHGWVDLVCKGTGTRIRDAEKALWDERVSVYWQKNAWVDNAVMEELARRFVRRKIEKHGKEVWVIAFCDNLKAHVSENVRKIFGEGHVFLCFFPPNMTHLVQPIDAGIGRSLRIAVGHALDGWLMDGANLMKWEAKMSAGERRILITKLVGQAMQSIMSADSLRVGAFERTGCLITMLISKKYDEKIRPQGADSLIEVPVDASLLDETIEEQVRNPVPQVVENLDATTQQIEELIAEDIEQHGNIELIEEENEQGTDISDE